MTDGIIPTVRIRVPARRLAAAIGHATRIADDRYDEAINDAARAGQAKD